jgi:hypothetical protein
MFLYLSMNGGREEFIKSMGEGKNNTRRQDTHPSYFGYLSDYFPVHPFNSYNVTSS